MPHEVLGSLEAGGMGEVYRARDSKAQTRRRDQDAAQRVLLRSGSPPAALSARISPAFMPITVGERLAPTKSPP